MSALDELEKGRDTADRLTSLVDWVKSLVTWVKSLFSKE